MKKLILITLLLTQIAYAQTTVPFTSDQWSFETADHKVENYLGRESLYLKKNHAFLKSAEFENGIIEYDLAFPEGRAFIGVTFRMVDSENNEEFYVRPHQSGNPDANQYTPVFNGVAAWQLYYGEGYGVPVKYKFDSWQHVKLVISGKFMDVYINDMNEPVMFSELKREPQKGYLGLGNFLSENHFANFTYTPMEAVKLKGTPKPKAEPAPGTVTQWDVSDPLSEKLLETVVNLKALKTPPASWKRMNVESTGTINLASVAKFSDENNSVLVRAIVNSDKDQVKKFTFGFSDRARVYLNNNVLYSGEDNFLSRDYRFLGTIGYFDSVYLNLKKGRNEIVFAVSETFGGWGLKGKFDDMNGISFIN